MELDQQKSQQLYDLELYFQDILATLYAVLRILPDFVVEFKPYLEISLLSVFYDQVIPALFKIKTTDDGQSGSKQCCQLFL